MNGSSKTVSYKEAKSTHVATIILLEQIMITADWCTTVLSEIIAVVREISLQQSASEKSSNYMVCIILIETAIIFTFPKINEMHGRQF